MPLLFSVGRLAEAENKIKPLNNKPHWRQLLFIHVFVFSVALGAPPGLLAWVERKSGRTGPTTTSRNDLCVLVISNLLVLLKNMAFERFGIGASNSFDVRGKLCRLVVPKVDMDGCS